MVMMALIMMVMMIVIVIMVIIIVRLLFVHCDHSNGTLCEGYKRALRTTGSSQNTAAEPVYFL